MPAHPNPSPTESAPSLAVQAERLISLGVPTLAGLADDDLRDLARSQPDRTDDSGTTLLVVDPALLPPSQLAPMLDRDGKPGFVVVDMPDVDEFAPVAEVTVPTAPCYLVHGVARGDELANWSPAEAMPALLEAGRTPLTLAEGIHWVLQQPGVLERNLCFMTIGSRLRKANGRFDARTPAVWISNGTGRDGRERRDAAKVGWCWWNNRHTWLGFASTTGRSELSG